MRLVWGKNDHVSIGKMVFAILKRNYSISLPYSFHCLQ